MSPWPMQVQSFAILALMIYGVSQHRRRLRHTRIMYAAMLWDVALILQIELSRNAILKASRALENPWALNIHVSIAVTTVVFYGFMLFTGRKVMAGDNGRLPLHRRLGYTTLLLRALTFATSFWAVVPKE